MLTTRNLKPAVIAFVQILFFLVFMFIIKRVGKAIMGKYTNMVNVSKLDDNIRGGRIILFGRK